jgi:hypothetical protein
MLYRVQKKKLKAQQSKHQEEQERLQYLHQLEMEKTEKELVNLRNEKLESEIQHTNPELASTAMHLVQKGELLGKVKEQMLKLKKHAEDDKDSEDLKKLIRTLGEEDKMDKQWEQFAVHFDKVHSDFLSVIKTKYPTLSANELKLCAYLRMNLTTKEIEKTGTINRNESFQFFDRAYKPKRCSAFAVVIRATSSFVDTFIPASFSTTYFIYPDSFLFPRKGTGVR